MTFDDILAQVLALLQREQRQGVRLAVRVGIHTGPSATLSYH